jgi:hypothetical protein
MIKTLEWTWNDGWILMSMFLTRDADGTPLKDIIAAADATNHAIPTPKELSRALSKFVQCELISASADRYLISAEFIPGIQTAIEGKGGLFQAPEKGIKWLKKSGLTIKNDKKIELTDEEVHSAYQAYIKAIHKRKNA